MLSVVVDCVCVDATAVFLAFNYGLGNIYIVTWILYISEVVFLVSC